MTKPAQFALRRIMELYSSNARFILICNDSFKIIEALKSRCVCFRFSPLNYSESLKLINNSINKEKEESQIEILFYKELIENQQIIDTIIKMSKGDARKILSFLQILISQNRDKEKDFDFDLGLETENENVSL